MHGQKVGGLLQQTTHFGKLPPDSKKIPYTWFYRLSSSLKPIYSKLQTNCPFSCLPSSNINIDTTWCNLSLGVKQVCALQILYTKSNSDLNKQFPFVCSVYCNWHVLIFHLTCFVQLKWLLDVNKTQRKLPVVILIMFTSTCKLISVLQKWVN